jgi:hypothetical protein
MKSATIIITTIGDPALAHAVQAALNQDHPNTKVWVVTNGREHEHRVAPILATFNDSRLSSWTVPENIGYEMLFGCRILAAACYLVDSDYLLFLNNDDWMDPNHVSSLIAAIETNQWDWGYSLRKIMDKDGSFLCNDNCESLGKWPAFNGQGVHHVDLSCFCLKKDVAPSVAHSLYYRQYHDRTLLACLRQHYPHFGTTGLYTLNYRLGGNPASVQRDFFEIGNQMMASRYPSGFPWNKHPPPGEPRPTQETILAPIPSPSHLASRRVS